MEEKEVEIDKQIEENLKSGSGPRVVRYILACLSGLIPLAGGAVGGVGGAWSEAEQDKLNQLLAAWLKLQEDGDLTPLTVPARVGVSPVLCQLIPVASYRQVSCAAGEGFLLFR